MKFLACVPSEAYSFDVLKLQSLLCSLLATLWLFVPIQPLALMPRRTDVRERNVMRQKDTLMSQATSQCHFPLSHLPVDTAHSEAGVSQARLLVEEKSIHPVLESDTKARS